MSRPKIRIEYFTVENGIEALKAGTWFAPNAIKEYRGYYNTIDHLGEYTVAKALTHKDYGMAIHIFHDRIINHDEFGFRTPVVYKKHFDESFNSVEEALESMSKSAMKEYYKEWKFLGMKFNNKKELDEIKEELKKYLPMNFKKTNNKKC